MQISAEFIVFLFAGRAVVGNILDAGLADSFNRF